VPYPPPVGPLHVSGRRLVRGRPADRALFGPVRTVTLVTGNAHPGRQRVGLRASLLAAAVGTGRIVGATLDVSFDDGATWQPAQLSRAGDGWSADFQALHGGYVSLRASAWDSAGNKITQEVIRAYGLGTIR
jgi:hypothetical protein